MQAFMMMAGLVVALIGQKLNTYPSVPALAVKFSLVAAGLVLYLVVDQPAAWTGQPLFEWLDEAYLWALALPGAASLIGLAPGMGTNSKPTP